VNGHHDVAVSAQCITHQQLVIFSFLNDSMPLLCFRRWRKTAAAVENQRSINQLQLSPLTTFPGIRTVSFSWCKERLGCILKKNPLLMYSTIRFRTASKAAPQGRHLFRAGVGVELAIKRLPARCLDH
jgi:hypothetical protein